MKPDGMIVEPEYIARAGQEIATRGSAEALDDFGKCEPALASFIFQSLAAVSGKLTLAGAPVEVVQGAHEEVLAVVLTCAQAMRRGHYELWKDTMTGTLLAQVDDTFRPRPRQRSGRRKKPDADR